MLVHLLEYIVQRNYVDLQTSVDKNKLWKYTFLLLFLDDKYAILVFHATSSKWINSFSPNDHSSDHAIPALVFNVSKLR